jgi:hypothetical protein
MSILRGINIHCGAWGDADTNNQANTLPRTIDVAASLGCKSIRMGIGMNTAGGGTPTAITRANWAVGLAHDRGMKATIVYQSPFGSSRTDSGNFPDTQAGRISMGTTLMTTFLNGMPIKPDFIELENEVTIQAGLTFFQGQSIGDYNTTAFSEWMDVIGGEYSVARSLAPASKIIVGTLELHFAYIDYVRTKGVSPDIAGYHIYTTPAPSATTDLRNWSNIGDIERKFNTWGIPVTVNEINAQLPASLPQSAALAKSAADAIDQLKSMPVVAGIEVYECVNDSIGSIKTSGMTTVTAGGWSVNQFCQPILDALLQ